MTRVRRRAAAVGSGLAWVVLSATAACSSSPSGGPAPSSNSQSYSQSQSKSVEASTPAPGGIVNPVYDTNFPDPGVVALGADQGYLAFATNGNGRNVQVVGSSDLATWEQLDDALPVLPDWTTEGKVWAPEVTRLDDGRWAMYYTTMAPDPALQCIGLAMADEPAGPYRDTRSEPLVCQDTEGGSIDAHPFRASDGRRYLFWKNDGNAVGEDTWIYGQELAADGESLRGEPVRLFRQTLPWEGDLVEAPFVVEQDGAFLMFYSANSYASADYAVGYATADSPLGTYTKHGDPILVSDDAAAGPGHCSVFTDPDGQLWMAYHAWPPDAPGDETLGRSMWLSRMQIEDGVVSVDPPAAAG